MDPAFATALIAAVTTLFGTVMYFAKTAIADWKALWQRSDEKLEKTQIQAASDARESAARIDKLTDKLTELGVTTGEILKLVNSLPRRDTDFEKTRGPRL